MSEQTAQQTLRDKAKLLRPVPHWQRFEDALSSGIPDANLCYQGTDIWLEAKYVSKKDLPKRKTTIVKPGLRVEQRNWITLRRNAGGFAFVWVRDEKHGWYVFPDHEVAWNGLPLEQWEKLPWKKTSRDLICEILFLCGLSPGW